MVRRMRVLASAVALGAVVAAYPAWAEDAPRPALRPAEVARGASCCAAACVLREDAPERG